MSQQRSAKQVRMFDFFKLIVLLILIILLLWAWLSRPTPTGPIVEATASPTEQPTPTDTKVPPTDTPMPAPTDTPVPTATTAPTDTPAPTATIAPTDTPLPPKPAPVTPPTLSLPENAVAGTIPFSGTGEPGSTVEIVLDGKSLGTVTVGADGTWQFPAEIADAGDFSVVARTIAADGSVLAESETQTLTVATPQPQTPEGQAYIVQANDWLSKLADKFYGDPLAYDAIVAATNKMAETDDSFTVIDNPDLIEIGQKLWIPPAP